MTEACIGGIKLALPGNHIDGTVRKSSKLQCGRFMYSVRQSVASIVTKAVMRGGPEKDQSAAHGKVSRAVPLVLSGATALFAWIQSCAVCCILTR